MTRHIATALALTGVLAGCQQKPATLEEFRAGVPRAETVQVEFQPSKAKALVVEEHTQALNGLPAEYAGMTLGVSLVINGGALFVGGLVKAVTLFQPTKIEGDTATWGPFAGDHDDINWRVTITRIADHQFEYRFEGQPQANAAAPFVAVLSGTHTAAVDDKGDFVEGFGAGSFTLDWNARQTLPKANPDDVGSATYSYSRIPGATATVTADFKQVKDKNNGGKLIDVKYQYTHHLGGSGTMDFTVDAAAQLGMPDGRATVRSRWEPTGAGRADATLTSSSLATPASASECWNQFFLSTYKKHSWIPILDYGTEATDCVYPTADFSQL
jgi:hypothetical protein